MTGNNGPPNARSIAQRARRERERAAATRATSQAPSTASVLTPFSPSGSQHIIADSRNVEGLEVRSMT